MPKYKPIHVGDKITETVSGHKVAIKGRAGIVSDVQFEAIEKAARARCLTVDQFVAVVCANKTAAAAREALRQAIDRYLPAGYQWTVETQTR